MTNRFAGLEALRGIAALVVAYTHVNYFYPDPQFGHLLFARGYVAVDLFFMLSGYVLTRTYEGRMPGSFEFFTKRFARLWPLMAIGTAMGALFFAIQGVPIQDLAVQLAFGLLILPALGFYLALNPPAWSIFFELVANWLHAAVFQRLSTRVLLIIAAICAAVIAPYALSHAMDIGQTETFFLGFPRVIMSYLIGVALYRWNGDRLIVPSNWAWPLVLSFPVCVWLLGFHTAPLTELAFVLVVGPVMVLGSLSLPSSRFALVLGGMSFPLYAVHVPVLWFAISAGAPMLLAYAISIVAGLAVGVALDKNCRAALTFSKPEETVRSLAT